MAIGAGEAELRDHLNEGLDGLPARKSEPVNKELGLLVRIISSGSTFCDCWVVRT
jgi:hypothetical protein